MTRQLDDDDMPGSEQRLVAWPAGDGLTIFDPDNRDAWLHSEYVVEVSPDA